MSRQTGPPGGPSAAGRRNASPRSPRVPRTRLARSAAAVTAVAAAALVLAGCTSTVDGAAHAYGDAGDVAGAPGHPRPATSSAAPDSPDTSAPASGSATAPSTPTASTQPAAGPLTALLPDPSAFPAGYSGNVVVLPHHDAASAVQDLTGFTRGARTRPVQCEPAAQAPSADDLAVQSSTDPDTAATVAVVLERVDDTLGSYRDTIAACTDVAANQFGAATRTTRTFVAAPSVDDAHGDPAQVVAFDQSVVSGDEDITVDRRSTVLVTQDGDVRIQVVGMSQTGDAPPAGDLAGLLSAALTSVQAG